MILSRLTLTDFRGYERLTLEFDPRTNLILGPNASGKTNIAEAVFYLSHARSWRTSEPKALIREGCKAATIVADVEEGALHREIRIELAPEGKRVFLNGKLLRSMAELSRLVNVLLFSPEDVRLFSGPPAERRSFLDASIAKRSSDYLDLILKAARLLKERNAVLKSREIDERMLEVLTEQLIEVEEPIVRYRNMYVSSINALLPEVLGKLRGKTASCGLLYRSFAKDDGQFKEHARRAYREAWEGDKLHKSTSVGTHREDFSFRLEGKDVARYGSQGENRMSALALKLTPYFLIEEAEKKPLCVLDDVVSELDEDNAARLLGFLDELGQCFLTATELHLDGASIIDVAAHNAIRRK